MQKEIDYSETSAGKKISRRRKRKRRLRRLRFTGFVLIIIIVFGGHFAVNNQFVRGLYFSNESIISDNNVIIEGDSGVIADYASYNDNIISVSKNGIRGFDTSGAPINEKGYEIPSRLVSDYQNPQLNICNEYALVYDKMGRSLMVFNKGGLLHNIKVDYNIIFASPYDNGYFLMITEDASAKSQIKLFNVKGREVFIWHSGIFHVMSASLSPDAKQIVVGILDLSSGKTDSKILFFNIDNAEPYEQITFEDALITNVFHYNRSNVLAISDLAVYYVNKSGEITHTYPFNERFLYRYALMESGWVALAFRSGGENQTVVETINPHGRRRGEYTMHDDLLYMHYRDGSLLLCSKRKVNILSKSGMLMRDLEYNRDLKRAFFVSRNKIVLVGNSEVKIIN